MPVITAAQKLILNQMGDYLPELKKGQISTANGGDIQLGTMIDTAANGGVYVASAVYDFAAKGGAIGTINLGVFVPNKAIIMDGVVDVLTTFVTASADAGTVALRLQGAGDLVAAIAVSDVTNPWDAGLHNIIPVGTAATMIKLTAQRQLAITIAGQVVTAGKLKVFLRYVISL